MVSTRVRFDDYVDGVMPDVSVLSGRATSHRVTLTNEVRTGQGLGSFLLHRLEALLHPGAPLVVLKGQLPMLADEQGRLERHRRLWKTSFYLAFVVLVAAAWSAATVAPFIVAAALVAMGISVGGGWATRRRWPRARIDESDVWVIIDGVHEAFADAVAIAHREA